MFPILSDKALTYLVCALIVLAVAALWPLRHYIPATASDPPHQVVSVTVAQPQPSAVSREEVEAVKTVVAAIARATGQHAEMLQGLLAGQQFMRVELADLRMASAAWTPAVREALAAKEVSPWKETVKPARLGAQTGPAKVVTAAKVAQRAHARRSASPPTKADAGTAGGDASGAGASTDAAASTALATEWPLLELFKQVQAQIEAKLALLTQPQPQ
jgi:hypothetical protein